MTSLRNVLGSPLIKDIVKSFSDPMELSRLENVNYHTSIQETYATHAVVGVWWSGKSFLNAMRCLGPSFFLSGEDIPCERHVQIIENIGGKRFCLLLSFKHDPVKEDIDGSLELLREQLGLSRSRRVVTSQLLRISKDRPLFRIDGSRLDNTASRKLSGALRDVIVNQKQSYRDPALQVVPEGRAPVCWVFVLRQSQEDSIPAKTSIPRQLWTMLTSNNAPFDKLEKLNKISVIVELCSSHKHPITDRMIFEDIPHDLPLVFLTANPDRLTRRDDEIELILAKGRWFTRGSSGKNTTWVDVQENKDIIKSQVNTGRYAASEVAKYGQMERCIDRTLAAGPEDVQFKSLQYLVAEIFRIHRIPTALIACRVSPPPAGTTEQDGIKTSLLRQQRFLEAMVPPHGVEKIYLKAKEVSAYQKDFKKLIQAKIESLPTKTLVLTTSLDRAARNVKYVKNFTELHQQRGHMFMSFLWSDKVELPVTEALRIPPAFQTSEILVADTTLEQQRCKSTSSRNLPLVKPVIWIPCSPRLEPVVSSTLEAAEKYSRSSITRFQGEPSARVPHELRKVDEEHVEQWKDFLTDKLPVPVDVTHAEKHHCECTSHDTNCSCLCRKCTSGSVCECESLGECVCPAICTCSCKVCHTRERDTIDCAVPQCSSPASGAYGQQRLCIQHDQEYDYLILKDERRRMHELTAIETIDALKSGKQFQEIFDEKMCNRPGCENPIAQERTYGKFCSKSCKNKTMDIMHAIKNSHLRICERLGCEALVPLGSNYSPFCSSSCLHKKGDGSQSLPHVLAIENIQLQHIQLTKCALTSCDNDLVNGSACCSKVCRILWDEEENPSRLSSRSLRVELNLKPDDEGYRKCNADGCDKHAPPNKKYGLYCSKRCEVATVPERQAIRDDRKDWLFYSDDEKPLHLEDEIPDYRKCRYEHCYQTAPKGSKYSPYCCKTCKDEDAPFVKAELEQRPRRGDAPVVVCGRFECCRLVPLGKPFGVWCSEICRVTDNQPSAQLPVQPSAQLPTQPPSQLPAQRKGNIACLRIGCYRMIAENDTLGGYCSPLCRLTSD
jgi:hypothetical protein